ncbi:MAG: hypothetical protein JO320_07370 [Alphaproteobacteria bacterium]|nr:hypothetical protein [Alphaproteobacteria bacterium]MBV9816535.1 hypothetical protein [Alphaproteobacteria bacterium]
MAGQQHPHILSDQFGCLIAGHGFGGSAELTNDAVLVTYDNRVDRGLEDRPITAFAFYQLASRRSEARALVSQPDRQ